MKLHKWWNSFSNKMGKYKYTRKILGFSELSISYFSVLKTSKVLKRGFGARFLQAHWELYLALFPQWFYGTVYTFFGNEILGETRNRVAGINTWGGGGGEIPHFTRRPFKFSKLFGKHPQNYSNLKCSWFLVFFSEHCGSGQLSCCRTDGVIFAFIVWPSFFYTGDKD